MNEVATEPAFDPENWTTWPVPDHGVNTRYDDGRVRRLSVWGDGWVDGFDMALRMADHFHKTGEWSTTA